MLSGFFRRNYFSCAVDIVDFFACWINKVYRIAVAVDVRRYAVVFCCQRVGLHEAGDVGGVGAGVEVVEVNASERIEFLAAVEIWVGVLDFRSLHRQTVGIVIGMVAVVSLIVPKIGEKHSHCHISVRRIDAMHPPVLELIVAYVVAVFSPAGLLYGVGRQWPVREITERMPGLLPAPS